MAVCSNCEQEMLSEVSCVEDAIVIDGTTYLPVRYGTELGYRRVRHPCGDCGVPIGGVHHHGCDVELCPCCRRQSISCDCLWAGEEHLSEDWLDELEERFLQS